MTHYDAIPLADVLREHIRGERIAHLTISGDSMTPLLQKGDFIGLRQVDALHIQRGQIVTVGDSDGSQYLFTHRIAASQQDEHGNIFILTRGDHMLGFDRPLKFEDVVGQVVWRIRDGRKLRLDQGAGEWLSEQLGRIAEFERLQVSGMPLERLQLTPDTISVTNMQERNRRDRLPARLLRAIARTWSRFLTGIVLLFAGQENIEAAGSL